VEAFEILLPLATNLEQPAADGRDLLAMACDIGDLRLVEMVLQRAPGNLEWTQRTRHALLAAISSGNKELIRLLLSRHPAPPTAEDGKVPLLAYAIATGDARVFEALLAAGTNLNVVLPTPVETSFVSLLKTEDLRAHARGDSGITPLMIAAGLGKAEYVRALLAAGAAKRLQTARYKMLALYFAAHAKNVKCIQMLLGRGPDPEQLRVEISLATQRASVIKDGVSILHTRVSTGRSGFDTPRGEYVITDKNRDHRSTVYHVDMPFFMRLNCLDFGMHAGAVPDYPASHGCIRLPSAVAEKLFTEIPVGTLVTIN
jgi:lipoprotein-anchoring transpeptidase ErfK/SrfK